MVTPMFQFLVVQLRVKTMTEEDIESLVSIPCGTIKRIFAHDKGAFRIVSIPCGTIKSSSG